MSYCVNCGVKLDDALIKCPLCNTPVINPKELKKMGPISPFPIERGETEKVKSKRRKRKTKVKDIEAK